jgi:hypothetical protein
MKRSMTNWKLKMGFFFLAGALLMLVAVMFLWNYTMPTLFDLPEITMLQAIGLLILSRILFGNWGRGHSCHGGWNHRRHWMHRMKDKWATMSPEEREKAKEKWGWAWEEPKDIGKEEST